MNTVIHLRILSSYVTSSHYLHLGKTWYLTLRDDCTVRIPAVKCLALLAHTLESQLKPYPREELSY